MRICLQRCGPALVMLSSMLLAGAAAASRPVPRTIEACVTNGVLTGSRYTYEVHVPTSTQSRPLDLGAFEGMTLRVRGNLLPGDILMMKSIEIIADTCVMPRQ